MPQYPTPAQGEGAYVEYALTRPPKQIPLSREYPYLSCEAGALFVYLYFRRMEGVNPTPLRVILLDTSLPRDTMLAALDELESHNLACRIIR